MADGSGFKLAGEPSTAPLPLGTLRLGLDLLWILGSFCLSFWQFRHVHCASRHHTLLLPTGLSSCFSPKPMAKPSSPITAHSNATYYWLSTSSSGWELLCPSPGLPHLHLVPNTGSPLHWTGQQAPERVPLAIMGHRGTQALQPFSTGVRPEEK